MRWTWIKNNALVLINLVGSIASTIGFAVLILSFAAADSNRPPKVVVWQFTFFVMCLVFTAASVIFTYFWIFDNMPNRAPAIQVLIGTVKLCTGIFLVGVGFDGLMSAIHWTWWIPLISAFIG